jgi:CRP/FNR family cyclic AMP-dependent transcriptional regulator
MRVQQQIAAEVASATWILATHAGLGNAAQVSLLAAALDYELQQTRERILFLLSFLYESSSILRARDALSHGSTVERAYALDMLDTLLSRDLKRYVLPLIEELPPGQRLARLELDFPQPEMSSEQHLQALITGQGMQTTWVRACALYTAGLMGTRTCVDAVAGALNAAEPLVRETAWWALSRLALDWPQDNKGGPSRPTEGSDALWARARPDTAGVPGKQGNAPEGSIDVLVTAGKGDGAMLSTIEKVLVLKTVSIFSETPDEVLADVASIVEELEVKAGTTIIKVGELGTSMYVIVSGRVRVHLGEHALDELGSRDVFGELALLDAEPRSASVTAIEDTHLFCLGQTPFYELMADRFEVARGIIRVLAARLRARLRDLPAPDGRIQELEQAAQGYAARPF